MQQRDGVNAKELGREIQDFDTPPGGALKLAADRRVVEELGVHPKALRSWVKKAQVDGGLRSGTITDEAA
mgnify:CR=1